MKTQGQGQEETQGRSRWHWKKRTRVASFTSLHSLKFLKFQKKTLEFFNFLDPFKSLAQAKAKVGAGADAPNSLNPFIPEFLSPLDPPLSLGSSNVLIFEFFELFTLCKLRPGLRLRPRPTGQGGILLHF